MKLGDPFIVKWIFKFSHPVCIRFFKYISTGSIMLIEFTPSAFNFGSNKRISCSGESASTYLTINPFSISFFS